MPSPWAGKTGQEKLSIQARNGFEDIFWGLACVAVQMKSCTRPFHYEYEMVPQNIHAEGKSQASHKDRYER